MNYPTDSQILKKNLENFNNGNMIKLEYSSVGGKIKYLKFKGERSKGIICTKAQALDILDFIQQVLNRYDEMRRG